MSESPSASIISAEIFIGVLPQLRVVPVNAGEKDVKAGREFFLILNVLFVEEVKLETVTLRLWAPVERDEPAKDKYAR